jgi:hypothetical protein
MAATAGAFAGPCLGRGYNPAMLRKILIGVSILAAAGLAAVVTMIGPRNVIGMLRYDTRKEGALRPGSLAPDVALTALDGKGGEVRISDRIGARPLVLVFGSFT